MRTNYWRLVGGMVLLSGMMALLAFAVEENEGGARGGKGREAMRQFRREQMEVRRERFKVQMEQNRQFHETLKDKQPNDACSDIIKHRRRRYRGNTAFMDGQHKASATFVTNLMNKNEIPAERQAERLEKMSERYQEMRETHRARHKEVIVKLKELRSKEDLTWEELKAAMQEFRRRGGRGGRAGERPARGERGQGKQDVR